MLRLISITLLVAFLLQHAVYATEFTFNEIRFFKVGQIVVFHTSDIAETEVIPESIGDGWDLKVQMTPEMAARNAAFSRNVVDRRLVGIFDGFVWFTNVRVFEPTTLDFFHVSGSDIEHLRAFSDRYYALRDDPDAQNEPLLVMFEKVDEIAVMRSEIGPVQADGQTAELRITRPISNRIDRQDDWVLILGDREIKDWDMTSSNGADRLVVRTVDPHILHGLLMPLSDDSARPE